MVGLAAAFAIALGWSLLAIWIGPKVGWVDEPGPSALKVHRRPTPLLGGIGIFTGIHVGMFIEGVFDPGLAAATTIIVVVGLIDDRRGLSAKLRLAVEILAAVVLVAGTTIGSGSTIMAVLGVIGIVVAINAVNLFDGLDGLVGSVTVVSGLMLGWVGSSGFGTPEVGFTLAAATAGFLVVNWRPARVFLGDNGAYLIGMVLAYGVLMGGEGDLGVTIVLGVGALGVVLGDLAGTIARRARMGTPLFAGDRSHIYDRLRDRGMSVPAVALIAAGSQAVLAALTILLLA